MALKFSMILEAIDRASAPAKRARQNMEGLTGAARRFGAQIRSQRRDVDNGARSLEHYQRRARRLRQVALHRTFRAGAASARRMARNVGQLARRLRLVERAGKAAGRGMKWLGSKAMNLAKWGLAAGAAAGGYALFDMFKDAGNAEQAQSELAAFLGSAEEARIEMDRLKKSNFGVPIGELMTAYVALREAGIEPTNRSIQIMADEAQKSKKSLSEIVGLVAEARRGDFGGLSAAGIEVTKRKGMLALTFLDKTGKRVSRSVRDSSDELEDALLGIFEGRSAGAVARYENTFLGMIQGFRNRWNSFQQMVADAGIFDTVKAKLDEWMTKLDAMAKDGTLKKWAKDVSDQLKKWFDWATSITQEDWDALVRDFKKIAEAAMAIADAVLMIATNWGKVSAAMKIAQPLINPLGAAWDVGNAMFGGGSGKAPSPARKSSSPPKKPVGLPSSSAWKGAQNDTTVSGSVGVDINVIGNATAKVRTARSDNPMVPLVLRLGRTMAGAA